MRIGFDGRFIRHGQSGDGVFTQELLKGLARLDNDNTYTVYLLENRPFLQKDNFRLKHMPAMHANSHLRFLVSFPLELARNPVDLFHAVHTVPLMTAASRVVLHLVEFGWIVHPEQFPASTFLLSQLRLITRHSVCRADSIVTATRFWRDKLLDYYDLPEKKVVVVPHGVNEQFLALSSAGEISAVRQKFGTGDEYVLSVGDLHPRKNLVRLIEAFAWLKQSKRIPHKLVLVGKALYEAASIYRHAASCGAGNDIVFTGYVTVEELRALYQGASLFAFPSLDEGFGLPVHEAMASRVPVVVSNRGSLPEISGDAASIVDPLSVEDIGSAIFRILDSPAVRTEHVQRGLNQIKNYSWEESSRKILHIYHRLA